MIKHIIILIGLILLVFLLWEKPVEPTEPETPKAQLGGRTTEQPAGDSNVMIN